VEAHWIHATVHEGKLILEGLPFKSGEAVDVLVVSQKAPCVSGRSLIGSALEYQDPFDPVRSEDWEVRR
jgi:hypothetical protein